MMEESLFEITVFFGDADSKLYPTFISGKALDQTIKLIRERYPLSTGLNIIPREEKALKWNFTAQ